MLTINNILKKYSNGTISTVSGYPVQVIYLLRKNKIAGHIQMLPGGSALPSKTVLINKIENSFELLSKN